MADFASTYAAGIAALDELCLWQGQPTVSSQLAGVATITAARDNALAAVADMKAAAQAAVARDASIVEGQAVLDAATARGL